MTNSMFPRDTLFHGTTVLSCFPAAITTTTGPAAVHHQLGAGFYTTPHFHAACLFSHLAVRDQYALDNSLSPLQHLRSAETATIGRIYTIKLFEPKILKAGLTIDQRTVQRLILQAEVPRFMQESFLQREICDVYTLARLLSFSNHMETSSYEFITRQLGYDALAIVEPFWNGWHLYPEHLGLTKGKFIPTPLSVVIYNTGKIVSYTEVDPAIIKRLLVPQGDQ